MNPESAGHRDVIIIGGGISGTAAAWNLAQRGNKVTLLERGDLASMASGWTLAGVRQSGRHPAELPLAKSAIRHWEHLHELLDADVEYRQEGNLRLALIEEEIDAIRQVVAEGNAAGIETHYLEPGAIRELAPALSHDLAGASWCPTDGHANPTLAVSAFATAARTLGADIRTGVHVESLLVDGNRITGVLTNEGELRADTVIVAAGIYTPTLLTPLGLDLPLAITIVTAVQSTPLPPILTQVLGVASGGVAGRQQVSGHFRFTGSSSPWGHEGWHSPESTRPPFGRIADAIARTVRILPVFAEARINDVWGGLIDHTPDAIPVIQRSTAYDGLVIAAGFSGHGFCLGPITGEILADLATDGTTAHPIDAFTLERFASLAQADEAVQLHG
jgi:sarcosine oxidase subunit beta